MKRSIIQELWKSLINKSGKKNNYITLVVIFLRFWRLKNISLCRKIFGDITWKTTVHVCCVIQEKTDGLYILGSEHRVYSHCWFIQDEQLWILEQSRPERHPSPLTSTVTQKQWKGNRVNLLPRWGKNEPRHQPVAKSLPTLPWILNEPLMKTGVRASWTTEGSLYWTRVVNPEMVITRIKGL